MEKTIPHSIFPPKVFFGRKFRFFNSQQKKKSNHEFCKVPYTFLRSGEVKLEGQEQAVADEKAVQEQTAVKINVSNTSANKIADDDIDDFLNEFR